MTYRTVEELREAFQEAEVAVEAIDIQLTELPTDAPEEQVLALRAKFDHETAEVQKLAEALERKEKLERAKAAVPRPPEEEKAAAFSMARIQNEPKTYRQSGPFSFFRDVLYATKEGDPGAQARLAKHQREMQAEGRAMDTSSSSGLGFVAPQYLQEQWAAFARAGRPLADAIGPKPLPASGTNFNIPRVTTGSTVNVQATEGGAVTDSTPIAGTVSMSVETVAGKVDMSRQLFDRSDPAMEAVIGQDLASSYAQSVDSEIINGPGSGGRVKGILNATLTTSVTYTQATPTAGTLYPKLADAVQRIDTNRFMPADLIVMHPRRWASLLAALDSQNRPLVVPRAPAVNPMGVQDSTASQGLVGYTQGLDTLKDPNLPTTNGAGTNQDVIIVTRKEDLLLFESTGGPTIRVYEEVLSGTLQVRILAFGYIAFTAERYPQSTVVISGTGLVAPSF